MLDKLKICMGGKHMYVDIHLKPQTKDQFQMVRRLIYKM